jgi:hypothetical protein
MHLPKVSLLLTGVLSIVLMLPSLSYAFTAANNETKIDIGGIDIAPTNTPVPTLPLHRKPTPKIVLPRQATTSVKQGDKIQPEKRYFTFSLSTDEIDFGTIDPTNPVLRTHQIQVDPGPAQGYTLFGYQNHHLGIEGTPAFIPDTTCDDGNCTESIASVWENTLTYGLGLRCDLNSGGNGSCLSAFSPQHSYKQLADLSQSEPGTIIISSHNEKPLNARLTYKLNLPGTQKSGNYTNAVVLIAAPGY